MLSVSERRQRFRRLINGPEPIRPTSVFDAVSAHLAEAAGFEVAIVAGSTASYAILGAPDITLITLTELAEQVRRVTRSSSLCIFVDADHGYGNSLNVMRTIEELETAGACAVTIEDTSLPRAFGGREGDLISVAEFESKLRAALSARSDPDFLVVGRTHALQRISMDAAKERLAVCNAVGVDAAFVAGVTTPEQMREVAAATPLPLILPNLPPELAGSALLAECHVGIDSWDHVPFNAVVQALSDAYAHLFAGRPLAELRQRSANAALTRVALDQDRWDSAARELLG